MYKYKPHFRAVDVAWLGKGIISVGVGVQSPKPAFSFVSQCPERVMPVLRRWGQEEHRAGLRRNSYQNIEG